MWNKIELKATTIKKTGKINCPRQKKQGLKTTN